MFSPILHITSSPIIDGRLKVGRSLFSFAHFGSFCVSFSPARLYAFFGAPLSHYIDLSCHIRAQIISYVTEERKLSQRAREVITSCFWNHHTRQLSQSILLSFERCLRALQYKSNKTFQHFYICDIQRFCLLLAHTQLRWTT